MEAEELDEKIRDGKQNLSTPMFRRSVSSSISLNMLRSQSSCPASFIEELEEKTGWVRQSQMMESETRNCDSVPGC